MFEKVTTTLEPFALTMVVIAGLVLAGRIEVADRGIVGYVTIFVGVALILVHVIKDLKTKSTKKKDK